MSRTSATITAEELASIRSRVEAELADIPLTDIEDQIDQARRDKVKHLADLQELKVKLMKGQAHRCEHVDRVLGDMASNCRARLLSIPTKTVRALLAQKAPAYIATLLREPFAEALQQWIGYDAEIFFQMTREYRTAGANGAKEDNAPNETNEED
jgi:hypothetical protein